MKFWCHECEKDFDTKGDELCHRLFPFDVFFCTTCFESISDERKQALITKSMEGGLQSDWQ